MEKSYLFWALLAALSWGIAPILDKMGLLKMNPALVLLFQALVVFVFLIPYCYFKAQSEPGAFMISDWSSMGIIIVAAIVGGLIGEYAYLKAISSAEAGRAVALTSAYPIVTLVISILFLGEGMTLASLAGVGLVVTGVSLITQNGF